MINNDSQKLLLYKEKLNMRLKGAGRAERFIIEDYNDSGKTIQRLVIRHQDCEENSITIFSDESCKQAIIYYLEAHEHIVSENTDEIVDKLFEKTTGILEDKIVVFEKIKRGRSLYIGDYRIADEYGNIEAISVESFQWPRRFPSFNKILKDKNVYYSIWSGKEVKISEKNKVELISLYDVEKNILLGYQNFFNAGLKNESFADTFETEKYHNGTVYRASLRLKHPSISDYDIEFLVNDNIVSLFFLNSYEEFGIDKDFQKTAAEVFELILMILKNQVITFDNGKYKMYGYYETANKSFSKSELKKLKGKETVFAVWSGEITEDMKP